ncbi:MAG: hypothetical protein EZS28_028045, partial [Streblomastix strix]
LESEKVEKSKSLERQKEIETKLFEKETKRAEIAEKTITELEEKFLSVQNEVKIKGEENEKLNSKTQKELLKSKEEERKRKEVEDEKLQVDEENWQLKRENEKVNYQIVRMKQKFGEKIVDEEIQMIKSKEKEKDNKINQLEEMNKQKDEQLERERSEKEKQKKRADEADERTKIDNEKFIRAKQEKERKEEEIKLLKEENSKLKQENTKLKEENRKSKSDIPENYPIKIHNPDPQDISFTDINRVQKKISKNQTKDNTVSLTQVLENGIWQMEAEFQNSQCIATIGIVEDSYVIPAGAYPWGSPYKEHMVVYTGKNYKGSIWQRGKEIDGNTQFSDNQIIRLEMDCEKGRLTFFLNDVQQPLFISGIKDKVRFIIYTYHQNSICTIRSLKKLVAPTSKHFANEKAIQW